MESAEVRANPGPQRDSAMDIAGLAVLAVWLALHFLWRWLDHTPPRGDQVGYALGALHVTRTFSLSFLDYLRGLNDVTETLIRPPGASLLLAPWTALFNGDLRLANLACVLWHTATFALLIRLGSELYSRRAGILAAVFYIGLPLIYGVEIDPEFYFMTGLPLALLCCLHLWDESRAQWAWWQGLGLVIAFGLLTKWIFAIYLLGPAAIFAVVEIRRIREQGWPKGYFRGFLHGLLLTVPILLVAAFWYWPNRQLLVQIFSELAETREFTPFKEGWNWRVIFHYPGDFLYHNQILPSVILMLGITVPLMPGSKRRRLGLSPMENREKSAYWLLMSSVLGFWLYTTVRYENIPLKYLFPLLPVMSLLAVAWIEHILSQWLRNVLAWTIIGYGLFCAVWMHFAPLSWLGPSNLPQVVWIDPSRYAVTYAMPIPRPPHTEEWPFRDIAQMAAKLETGNVTPGLMVILPDLYYFDWRTARYELRRQVPHFNALPLIPGNGLLRLYNAGYILTSRGQVSRLPYASREQNPDAKTALALNRLIDRAPDWFWNHYRLVKTFAMPYGLPELQLYRLETPHGEESAAALCDFWLMDHAGEVEAWEQIRAVWRIQRNPARMAFAEGMIRALSNKNSEPAARTFDWIPQKSYEKLQLGLLALNRGRIEEGLAWLAACAEDRSACSGTAERELGQWHQRQGALDQAWEAYLQTGRLRREDPTPFRLMASLAEQQSQAEEAKHFQELAKLTEEIQTQNRRPDLYQKAADLLLQADRPEDALWYATQAWLAGLTRYPNLIPLHRALARLGKSWPDYESIPLPVERMWETLSLPGDAKIHLRKDSRKVFSFLNLDEGTYRLRWNQTRQSESAWLAFYLDDRFVAEKTDFAPRPDGTQFVIFKSPPWRDRLRIDCLDGEAELSNLVLEKVAMPISLMDSRGVLTIHGHWERAEADPSTGQVTFLPVDNTLRVRFSDHTDPRAWDYWEIEFSGAVPESIGFILHVRKDGLETQSLAFGFTPTEEMSPGSNLWRIPWPEAAKAFPFVVGWRMEVHFQNPGENWILRGMRWIREGKRE
ncbi:MAG: glycosyltransferase family 39 protein [bacterium]